MEARDCLHRSPEVTGDSTAATSSCQMGVHVQGGATGGEHEVGASRAPLTAGPDQGAR